MPFYSVVLPVYNRAALVRATLDSIEAQSFTDWELIVVDDGSTDGTLEILESYRARLGDQMRILRQEHAGPGAARNGGVAAARGRYVAFLDSDDLWFPWTLAFYREQLQRHNDPAFLVGEPLVFTGASLQPRLPAVAPQGPRVEFFADYLQAAFASDWISTSSLVVRRDVLEGKAFCPRAINCEDIDITLQLGTAPGFVRVHFPPTFAYRKHSGGITGDALRLVRGIEFLIENERAGRYPGGPRRRRQRLRALSRHVRPALLQFLARGYRRRAWRAWRRTLGWHLELGRIRFLVAFLLFSLRPLRRVSARTGARPAKDDIAS